MPEYVQPSGQGASFAFEAHELALVAAVGAVPQLAVHVASFPRWDRSVPLGADRRTCHRQVPAHRGTACRGPRTRSGQDTSAGGPSAAGRRDRQAESDSGNAGPTGTIPVGFSAFIE